MNTLDFLTAILPSEGGYYLVLSKKFLDKQTGEYREGKIHKFFTELPAFADYIETANLHPEWGSVWHANQTYRESVVLDEKGKKRWRVAQNRTSHPHKSLYVDIDCGADKAAAGKGYATKGEAFTALKTFLKQSGMPAPLVVDSGGGLHVYWPLTEAIDTVEWKQLAHRLSSACEHFGLIQDKQVTTDAGRILRPVDTLNRKYDPPRPVTAKNPAGFQPTPPDGIRGILSALPITVKPATSTAKYDTSGNLGDLMGHLPEYPPASLVTIADHCAQVAKMRDTLGDVSYEHWRGTISLGIHCTDGLETLLAWNARRAETGHQQCDVEQRFNDLSSGPTLCSYYAEHGVAGLCDKCVHAGKIRSPIRLGGVIEEQPEVVTEQAVTNDGQATEIEIPNLHGYSWKPSRDGKHGVMVAQYLDADGVVQESPFTNTRMFPIERIRDEQGKYIIRFRMILPDNKYRDFDVPTAAIATGGQELMRVFGAYEVYPTNNKDAQMRMTSWSRDWAENIKRIKDELQRYTSFGWTEDNTSFLLGTQLIRRGKPDVQVMVSKGAAELAPYLNIRKGTVEGWGKAVSSLYDRPGMEPMQYALLSGIGSILTPFAGGSDYRGIPCYMFSDGTGKGKSTVARLALSAWGDVDRLSFNGPKGATRNARFSRMSTLKNLPTNHDELTDVEAEFIKDLAFTISNGQDRSRCISDGAGEIWERSSGSWDCGTVMNGNSDMLAILAAEKGNTMAEAVRIFQIDVARYHIPVLDGGWVTSVVEQAFRNTGVVGEAFARWCIENPERRDEIIREESGALTGAVIDDNSFRFYKGHLICTLTAGRILIEEMGVLDFHMDIVRGWAQQHADLTCKRVKETNSTDPEEALSKMVGELAQSIMITYELRDSRHADGDEEPLFMPRDTVVGRYIYGSTKQQQFSGRLYLSTGAIKKWCLDNRMSPEALVEAATKEGAVISLENNRFYLGQGTAHPTGRTRVVCFDMNKVHGVAGLAPSLTLVKPLQKEETGAA